MITTNGVLSTKRSWMYDSVRGELLVYGCNTKGDMEWLVPVWPRLTDAEQDELSFLGSEFNRIRDLAKKEGAEYGRLWADAIDEDELNEWKGMSYSDFRQALENANAPVFASKYEFEQMDHLYDWEDVEEWREFCLEEAKSAAWDTLVERLTQNMEAKND